MDRIPAAVVTGHSDTYALLVGVNDYASVDGTPRFNLRGSLSSVAWLAWYCLEVLGMPADHVYVLTSQSVEEGEKQEAFALERLLGLAPGEAGAAAADKSALAHHGAATADEVDRGLSWLLEKTAAEGTAAVFAFAGHGALSADGHPLLCLGGTSSDLGKGVLGLAALKQRVAAAGARSRFVAILDCCHVTGPTSGPELQVTGLPSPGQAAGVTIADEDFDLSDRVLLAAQPGQSAHQMRLGVYPRGAFTFALVSAAERWRASHGLAHGSYKQVLKRATRMLKALGVPQTPQARWKANWGEALAAEPFLAVKAGPVRKTPDAVGRDVQIDTGWYTFAEVQGGTPIDIALVYATSRDSESTIQLGSNTPYYTSPSSGGDSPAPIPTECWYVNTANLSWVLSDSPMTVTKAALPASSPRAPLAVPVGYSGRGGSLTDCTPYLTSNETPSTGWMPHTSPPVFTSTTPSYFSGRAADGTNLWMAWDVTSTLSTSGVTYTLHQVVWFYQRPNAPAQPLTLSSTSDFSNTRGVAPAGPYYWSASKLGV